MVNAWPYYLLRIVIPEVIPELSQAQFLAAYQQCQRPETDAVNSEGAQGGNFVFVEVMHQKPD